MQYYLAPLEGITTFIYRRTYHKYFYPMKKYFTPFLSPHTKRGFNTREHNEILPEHNPGMYVVPQIMSNQAEGFIQTAKKLKAYGYQEVNLNLGCPSKTVVSRGRGAGFLAYPEELERFLDEVFTRLDMRISVKTRIGKENPDEFERLLSIYNRFPMEELIIHPRVQQDFYKNVPNRKVFAQALERSENPVCYNGDLFTVLQIAALKEEFPQEDCVMLGRGILRNPGLAQMAVGGGVPEKETFRAFHDDLLAQYVEEMSGDRNVLFKMKELWSYLSDSFVVDEEFSQGYSKMQAPAQRGELRPFRYEKIIRKCTDLKRYEQIIEELFANCSLRYGMDAVSCRIPEREAVL